MTGDADIEPVLDRLFIETIIGAAIGTVAAAIMNIPLFIGALAGIVAVLASAKLTGKV